MRKPLIGLTPGHNTDTGDITMRPTYLKALISAGAIPVVLPLKGNPEDYGQLAAALDGFVFTGGPDPHPFLFGEETHEHCGSVSSPRDTMELSLLPLIMETGKPILGICRGIQIINVGLGGDIYQDIESQYTRQAKQPFSIAHRQPYAYDIPSHTVELTPNSRMERLCSCSSLRVNSMHHQAVRNPAPGLTICALSPDGLIEGLEMPGYPWLMAVQWHPEYLWENDPAAARLFTDFVTACKI